VTLAAIPSPSTAVWHVLGLPVRAYALCIVLGIVVGCLVTEYRLRRRGVAPWATLDMAVWAVPFGIVGARIYHVITSPQGYFGEGGHPIEALYIWQGGLGIWGAVAGGALGAWFGARQLGLPLTVYADALAPGLPIAQAIGRFGNWFNNELYGSATTLPWGLRVHDMDRADPGRATVIDGQPVELPGLYHPTFLYEALWNIGVAVLVILLDRKFKFGRGRAFALYVMAYTVGRGWIELLRTDEANEFFGVRLNVFTSIVVFLGALAYFLLRKGPREYVVPVDAPTTEPEAAANDVSQADVTLGGTRSATPPRAYQVVSEQRFAAYQRTGILPPTDDPGTGVAAHDGGAAEQTTVAGEEPAEPAADTAPTGSAEAPAGAPGGAPAGDADAAAGRDAAATEQPAGSSARSADEH
jgi:prolipoprotein diacylglyceryl transferase